MALVGDADEACFQAEGTTISVADGSRETIFIGYRLFCGIRWSACSSL